MLIVTNLDRLGRNAVDVRATVEHLEVAGLRVHCLPPGGVDLTSPAGKMTMQIINAVAEFARDLLIERTNSGITRAKAEGKKFGRPSALTDAQKSEVLSLLAEGVPVAQIARQFEITRQTIMRIRATYGTKPSYGLRPSSQLRLQAQHAALASRAPPPTRDSYGSDYFFSRAFCGKSC